MNAKLGVGWLVDETVDDFTVGALVLVFGHNLQQLLIGLRKCRHVGCERVLDEDGLVVVHICDGDVDLSLLRTGVVATAISRPHFERVAAPSLSVKEADNNQSSIIILSKIGKTTNEQQTT